MPEPDKSITFIRDLDHFLRSKGFIPDSNSNEKNDREFYKYMKNKHPDYIDRWAISSHPDHLFDYWEHVYILVWKKKNSYLLDFRKGRYNEELKMDEYVDSLKEWIRTKYPEVIITIRREGYNDLS